MGTHDLDAAAWTIGPNAFPRHSSCTDQLYVLIRYAILAPSSHDTQPWRFGLEGDPIHLVVDTTRWLRVADPDQRELHTTLCKRWAASYPGFFTAPPHRPLNTHC